MHTPQPLPSSSLNTDYTQGSASEPLYTSSNARSLNTDSEVPPLGPMGTVFQQIHQLQFEKANLLLNRFRAMTDFFPFVIVPPTIDAKTLMGERPFLYKSIMAAAEQNPYEQRDQAKDIVQYLALHMFQFGEKNLDILLGVMVLIAWYATLLSSTLLKISMSTIATKYLCRGHHHGHFLLIRLTHLLHEALALLFDMGLNKAPFKQSRTLNLEQRSSWSSKDVLPTVERTLEERRAALGCFFLVSGYVPPHFHYLSEVCIVLTVYSVSTYF